MTGDEDNDLVSEFLGGRTVGKWWEMGRKTWLEEASLWGCTFEAQTLFMASSSLFYSLLLVCCEINGPLVHVLLDRESQVIACRNR